MITRLFIKDNLNFKNIELNFDKGLNVFTGISGAGKSVLMQALLAAFGLKETNASIIEVNALCKFGLDDIMDEEPNVFKVLKQNSARYFLNSQSISKKNLSLASLKYIKFLNSKQEKEFENSSILALLDALICDKNFNDKKENFKEIFTNLIQAKNELNEILQNENKLEELKEFASFEIEKISKINPKLNELEELLELKKMLSKKDKIISAWQSASHIFEYENSVIKALELCDIDSAFFSDTMSELKNARENANFDDFSDEQIEEILNRIQDLSGLERRYGSIENALKTLEIKKNELEKYEKIEFEKDELKKKISLLEQKSDELCAFFSKKRKEILPKLQEMINEYLSKLYLGKIYLTLENCPICTLGKDEVKISLEKTELKNVSSGELNRLRLAFLSVSAKLLGAQNSVLILDEIDANLSGKEAMSIAQVLSELAKNYQIFAISHQPQLSSKASKHFLVQKHNEISSVKELNIDERELELARMISGEHISKEAKEFAKKLLKEKK